MPITRRHFNRALAGAAATLALPVRSKAQQLVVDRQVWLLFTKSAGFEHDVIKPSGGTSFLARQLSPLFEARQLTLVETKDGRHFEPAAIRKFAGFVFYTTGDLTTPGTDGQPPMSSVGKQSLLDAVAAGTPFIGLHCASDTFHSPKDGPIDPYIAMLGGEFDAHGEQQRASAKIIDADFPGVGAQTAWTFTEEWYALKHISKDVRPVHVIDPAELKGDMYRRDPYPNTWTRLQGKGRVFYTAIGHREDVIRSDAYQHLIGGAIDWCRAAQ